MYHLEIGNENKGRPEANPKFYDAEDAFQYAITSVETYREMVKCYLVTGLGKPRLIFMMWEAKQRLTAMLCGSWKPGNWDAEWPDGSYVASSDDQPRVVRSKGRLQ